MGKVKTFEKYEEEVRKFHADGDMDKAHARAAKWSERVPLQFMIANNEQLPYTEELIELGHEVVPMPEKALLGFQQTGDYLCFLPEYKRYTGVIWERKSKEDCYSTLIQGNDRFMRECERACANPRFNYMLIGVEATREKLITYRPQGKAGASVQSRIGIIENIPPRFNYQVQFRWHGARKYAVKDLVRQNQLWLKYHYADVLGLE